MRLNGSSKMRYGMIGAWVGVSGILAALIALPGAQSSFADTNSGLVATASVVPAVSLEMSTGPFDLDLTPSSGAQSKSRAISVVTNVGGVDFTISTTNPNLVYRDNASVKDTFTAISGAGTTLSNMAPGTWGYAASTGSDCGTTYKGVPTSPTKLIPGDMVAGKSTIMFCIGAKGDATKAAGSYTGEFTLSATVGVVPLKYSVVYLDTDDNGNTTLLGADSYTDSAASHSFTLNNSYTKEGYTLSGWLLDNAGTKLNPGTTVTLQSSNPTARYFAVWE